MFFGYSIGTREKLHYSVVSAEGQILRTEPIQIPQSVMMHDFAITENYTIFMDLPLEMSLMNCYVYHTVNAWEEATETVGDEIVLVGCRMEQTDVIAPPGHSTKDPGHSMEVERANSKPQNLANLHRWVFNLKSGEMREEQLDDRVAEFPRYNEALTGRRNRYSYTGQGTMPDPGQGQLFYGLIKYDLQSGTSVEHNFGPNRYGGEAAFVPRPAGSAEDDGWLVTIVFDEATESSELVVVDAQHLDQPPVARVLMPQRVPYGFHSIWLDDGQIG